MNDINREEWLIQLVCKNGGQAEGIINKINLT